MMDYFEARDRLGGLIEFRKLYKEYISFTNRENNIPAQIIKDKLEPLLPMTVDSLNRAGLGALVARNAPTLGGKTVKVNIMRAIFRQNIIDRFRLEDNEPLRALDKGIMVYQTRLWKRRMNLFNPFFWLHNFIAYIAQHPLLILRRSGFDPVEAEKSPVIRVYMVLFQSFIYFLILKWIGLIDWIWFDILGY